jgi:hypothetical protein
MTRAQVHYEVFIRSKPNAPWTLQFASEDRHRAVETAEELLATGGAAAVRVFKETLDEETREYQSVSILSKGAVATVSKRRVDAEADSPLCVAPQDLYSAHARERIGRLLDGWLRRKAVTAFELLHRPDLAEELDASGVELLHAVQKIAIPEAQARGLSTHEVIRTFQKLVERTLERIIKDGKAKTFPNIANGTFAAVATRLSEEDVERSYVLGGSVAAQLAASKSWCDKVERILDLADCAPPSGRERALALSVLEQPLSEILASHGGVADLVGPGLDLGASLGALTRLAADDAVRQVSVFDPSLERNLPPLPAHAARLSVWLKNDAFALVRAGLTRRIIRELKGPRRLRPTDPDGEIAILRALAMALSAVSGDLVDPEDVQVAFIERSKALVAGDFVHAYLEGRDSAFSEVQALVRLAENVAGALNKRTASRWILSSVTALKFEREARSGPDNPSVRLATLASLQKSVKHAGLAEGDAEEIALVLGKIGGMIESDVKLAASIARSAAPTVQRLILLLQMAAGDAAPSGPAAERARIEAMKMMRAPATRSEIASAPSSFERIKTLIERAGLAA